jgi:hypothetical protein
VKRGICPECHRDVAVNKDGRMRLHAQSNLAYNPTQPGYCEGSHQIALETDDCPNVEEHTLHPTGYNAYKDWADNMHRHGYRQHQCPGCGLFEIWRKRESRSG